MKTEPEGSITVESLQPFSGQAVDEMVTGEMEDVGVEKFR